MDLIEKILDDKKNEILSLIQKNQDKIRYIHELDEDLIQKYSKTSFKIHKLENTFDYLVYIDFFVKEKLWLSILLRKELPDEDWEITVHKDCSYDFHEDNIVDTTFALEELQSKLFYNYIPMSLENMPLDVCVNLTIRCQLREILVRISTVIQQIGYVDDNNDLSDFSVYYFNNGMADTVEIKYKNHLIFVGTELYQCFRYKELNILYSDEDFVYKYIQLKEYLLALYKKVLLES